MATIRHPDLDIVLADPDTLCTLEGLPPENAGTIARVVSTMILSASGWRGVFALDGDEESATADISLAHRYIVAAAARSFVQILREEPSPRAADREDTGLCIAVATDSRPTGPSIANEIIRVLLALGCTVRYSSITTIPEFVAWCRIDTPGNAACDGFIYVSASHNPIGHNGLKFGRNNGGVLEGSEATRLIGLFREDLAKEDFTDGIRRLLAGVSRETFARVMNDVRSAKRHAASSYKLFTRRVIADSEELKTQDKLLDRFEASLKERPLGVVVDFNGSARATALDRDFLEELGVEVRAINDRAGTIAHRIVPEGISLEPCAALLEESHRDDEAFSLGYMSDCDGDRGNLVVWDESILRTRALEAQEVFALALLAELAHQKWLAMRSGKGTASGSNGKDSPLTQHKGLAIAINDPTSLRADHIARAFGARIFRAEVGEANVVNLARRLRGEGYEVRILGEGAAGGTITHPSAVRDPLNTLFALLKLLCLRSDDEGPGLFEIWCQAIDRMDAYYRDFDLADIIATLPAVATTAVYEDRALLKIESEDHSLLKDRFEAIFRREWAAKAEDLAERAALASWEAFAYNGTVETLLSTSIDDRDPNDGPRSFGYSGRGGLRILFRDSDGEERGFIWMRGSGTEPVFRIMAEYGARDRGQGGLERFNRSMETELLDWLRAMVREADRTNRDR